MKNHIVLINDVNVRHCRKFVQLSTNGVNKVPQPIVFELKEVPMLWGNQQQAPHLLAMSRFISYHSSTFHCNFHIPEGQHHIILINDIFVRHGRKFVQLSAYAMNKVPQFITLELKGEPLFRGN
mmetsp:Transcript_27744/g.75045  ORF Transcript_27744/g.75045 Transcript_27744/m.75045 type:complete len:124 (+) Transcript_27744:505-876(+)